MTQMTVNFEEDHAQKIREAFAILTQGVEMIHYSYDHKKKTLQKGKQIVWMDSDILRVCVDDKRPTLIDRAKGKMSPGLFMRDIAVVRSGDDSYFFQKNSKRPTNPDCCLSLIGSERTISLELPGRMERDWFFERFQLIARDILTAGERDEKEKRKWIHDGEFENQMTQNEIASAIHLQEILGQGTQIYSHHKGEIMRSVLTFNAVKNTIVLQPSQRSYLGFLTNPPMTLSVLDIAEIRPGTHSIGFVRTSCTDKFKECLSIIGTECVFDLQLVNENARDVFASKFRIFVMYLQLQKLNMELESARINEQSQLDS